VAAASTVALGGNTRLVVTREMTVHYLAPGQVGPIRADGELVRVGTSAATVEVKVHDVGLDERLMAVALVSFAEVTGDRSQR
jgi:acyl-coenzyme A thioesterase PaaI-like protein